jgi:hypothetical protein
LSPTIALAVAQELSGGFIAQLFALADGVEFPAAWQSEIAFLTCFLSGGPHGSRVVSLAHQEYPPAIELLLHEADALQWIVEADARFPDSTVLNILPRDRTS